MRVLSLGYNFLMQIALENWHFRQHHIEFAEYGEKKSNDEHLLPYSQIQNLSVNYVWNAIDGFLYIDFKAHILFIGIRIHEKKQVTTAIYWMKSAKKRIGRKSFLYISVFLGSYGIYFFLLCDEKQYVFYWKKLKNSHAIYTQRIHVAHNRFS